jgi:hypothetical protein
MRQIGMRQEASRLGGIGSCGRELCCSTWLTDFKTVSTSAARYQNLSLNTLKLAGQCGKLKCCLNYELDTYMDALKHIPDNVNYLKTEKGDARLQKTDIFKKIMWFAYPREEAWIPLPISKVKEIQQQNRDGVIPADLGELVELETKPAKALDYENVVGQDSLTRLDERRNNNNNKNKNKNRNRNSKNPNQNPQQANQPRPAGVVQNNRPPRPEGSRPVDGNRPKAPRLENNKPVDGNSAEGTRPEGAKPQGNNQNRRHKHRRPNQNNQNRPDNPGPSTE